MRSTVTWIQQQQQKKIQYNPTNEIWGRESVRMPYTYLMKIERRFSIDTRPKKTVVTWMFQFNSSVIHRGQKLRFYVTLHNGDNLYPWGSIVTTSYMYSSTNYTLILFTPFTKSWEPFHCLLQCQITKTPVPNNLRKQIISCFT